MRNPRNEPLADKDKSPSRLREGLGVGLAEAAPSPDVPTPAASRSDADRRCVLSGQSSARDALVRLALSPEGDVLPDVLARAPGRGAWIGVPRAELERAVANGKLKAALSRAFKTGAVTIPADLADRVEAALRRALLDRLGLELRSGRLILGSDRIDQDARLGRVAALYHAADASADGARKLDQAWRVGMEAEGSGQAGIRLPLDRAALSVALGRGNVVHLALADRASAERVAIPLQRLLNFLGAAPAAGNAAERHDAAERRDDDALSLKDG